MRRKILLTAALCLAAGAQSAHADYWARWDRLGGGWTTNWVASGRVAHLACR